MTTGRSAVDLAYMYMYNTALMAVRSPQMPPIRITQASPQALLTYPVYLFAMCTSIVEMLALTLSP